MDESIANSPKQKIYRRILYSLFLRNLKIDKISTSNRRRLPNPNPSLSLSYRKAATKRSFPREITAPIVSLKT